MPNTPLKNVYDELTDIVLKDEGLSDLKSSGVIFINYSTDARYPVVIDGKIEELPALELLEVGCKSHGWEHVAIARFECATRILYCGEDANSLKNTLLEMRLHKNWSENAGERVFMGFRDECLCKEMNGESYDDLRVFEQGMVPGIEHHYRFILEKLIKVYRQRNQSQKVENPALSGLVFLN